MQISYCDSCGTRISPDDIERGAALQDSEIGSFCAKCAPSRRAADAPGRQLTNQTSSGIRAPRVSTTTAARQSLGPKRKPKTDVILIAAAAGVLVFVLFFFLFSGKNEPGSATKTEPPLAPALVHTPDAVKQAVPLEIKTPDPARAAEAVPQATPAAVSVPKDEIEDIRQNFVKRKWAELKARAEHAATYAIRTQMLDFSTSYKTLLIGKEADEFLKRLPPVDPPLPEPKAIIAAYCRDFKPNAPAQGWRYLWNQGAIGVSSLYAPLLWNANIYGYCPKGDVYPAGVPGGFLHLGADGGHPGYGITQGAGAEGDRFCIAAYRLQTGQNGKMAILGTVIRNDKTIQGTLELRIYLNDIQKLSKQVEFTGEPLEFAVNLNTMKEGDTIFVCVGPDKSDVSDKFTLDFSLYSIP